MDNKTFQFGIKTAEAKLQQGYYLNVINGIHRAYPNSEQMPKEVQELRKRAYYLAFLRTKIESVKAWQNPVQTGQKGIYLAALAMAYSSLWKGHIDEVGARGLLEKLEDLSKPEVPQQIKDLQLILSEAA